MKLSPIRSLTAGMLVCLGTLTGTAASEKPATNDLRMLAEARHNDQTKRFQSRTNGAGRSYDAGGRYLGRLEKKEMTTP